MAFSDDLGYVANLWMDQHDVMTPTMFLFLPVITNSGKTATITKNQSEFYE